MRKIIAIILQTKGEQNATLNWDKMNDFPKNRKILILKKALFGKVGSY